MTLTGGYNGKLYRALNPLWAAKPLSGEGAARFGGRFNSAGVPALYCSLDPLTALREANQVGELQPTILVAFDATIERVFDSCSATRLSEFGLSPGDLADPAWREIMVRDGEAPTQRFARELAASGFAGLLVRSFARGAGETGRNLVFWRWGGEAPHRLTLIDDENRLGA